MRKISVYCWVMDLCVFFIPTQVILFLGLHPTRAVLQIAAERTERGEFFFVPSPFVNDGLLGFWLFTSCTWATSTIYISTLRALRYQCLCIVCEIQYPIPVFWCRAGVVRSREEVVAVERVPRDGRLPVHARAGTHADVLQESVSHFQFCSFELHFRLADLSDNVGDWVIM